MDNLVEPQYTLPDEVGSYVWLECWSCGCCIIDMGEMVVTEPFNGEVSFTTYDYINSRGEKRCFWFNGPKMPKMYDGKFIITAILSVPFMTPDMFSPEFKAEYTEIKGFEDKSKLCEGFII